MLSRTEFIERSLEYVKNLVQTSIQNERTREGSKMKRLQKKEHHAPIYGHAIQPSCGMTGIKKRRAVSVVIRGENVKLKC
jgi:hypothetical protein